MNKNTVTGLLIIVIAMIFFQSPVYLNMHDTVYEKITGKKIVRDQKTEQTQTPVSSTTQNSFDNPTSGEATLSATSVGEEEVVPGAFDTITLENDLIKLLITEQGGRIISAKMKDYTYDTSWAKNGGELVQLVADQKVGLASLSLAGQSVDNRYFEFLADSSSSSKLLFKGTLNEKPIYKEFSLDKGSYYVNYKVTSDLLSQGKVITGLASGINESEEENNISAKYSPRFVSLSAGKKVERISTKKQQAKLETGHFDWIGVSSKYFSLALIPETVQGADIRITPTIIDPYQKHDPNNMNYSLLMEKDGGSNTDSYKYYIGPNVVSHLKEANVGLEKTVFRGYGWFFGANIWFPKICGAVLWMMNKLYLIFNDYGIVILLLTILLKIITFPLSHSSMKSMSKMRDIQPKIQAIQKKYKDNPVQMQQELMHFYKEEGVNPLAGMGGCLPMLLQFPIMISFYVVFRKAIELRGGTTILVPWVDNLAQPEVLFTLPFELPFYGSNFALLPIIYAVLMFFQQKQTMKDPNQQAMVVMMPIIMLVMFNNFPSGLTLYFALSSVFQLLQQWMVDKGRKKGESSAEVVKTIKAN